MSAKQLDFLIEELKQAGYNLRTEHTVKKAYSYYLIERKTRILMAKIYKKKDVFSHFEYRNSLNRELHISDLIKTNFSYLLQFYDFFYTKNFAVFIYEYCPSGSIHSVIRTDKFTPSEIVIIARDIFHALEEMKF